MIDSLPRNRAEKDDNAYEYNSADKATDRRVVIKNTKANPVPVEMTTGPAGDKRLNKHIGLTVVDASETTLFSHTVDATKVRELEKLVVACRLEGIFRLLVDGDQILSGRTGITSPNVDINLHSYEEVDENIVIELKFKPRLSAVQRSIEAYLTTAERDK